MPAARLEQIKQRAHTELLQLRQEEEEAAQLQQRQQQQGKGLKGRPQEGGGGSIELHASATAAAAEAVGAAIAAGGGAAWVSARDALSARITQVRNACVIAFRNLAIRRGHACECYLPMPPPTHVHR